jgi:serine/threonine-protein kinase RsbW
MAVAAQRLELGSDLSEINRLRELVEQFGSRHGLSSDIVYQLNLALEEIVTNIISYGLEDREGHFVGVELRIDGDEVSAQVEDDGAPFDPTELPPPDIEAPIEQRRVGGLGIHLVRELMDDLAYSRTGNKNILTLRKRMLGGSDVKK